MILVKKSLNFCVIFFLCFYLYLEAQEDEVRVDLLNPTYSEGTLKTEEGGVVVAPHLRIQARSFCYKHLPKDAIWSIEAENDLLIQFGRYTLTGKKLFYDFSKKEGILEQGIAGAEPWFFGGASLELQSDDSITIHQGYGTTSERDIPEWGIFAETVSIDQDSLLKAKNIQVRYKGFSLLPLPSFSTHLNSILESPLKYRFRWGGRQGPRVGITYQVFSWNHWKAFLRFDYRLTRGPGGGIELDYKSQDERIEFQSINYLAKDSSLLALHEKARYRFEGIYKQAFKNDKTTLLFTYDKISDEDMPNCYEDQDFFIETSYRTQLLARHQEEDWISHLYSRIRINSFQTVKEELPTLSLQLKPRTLSSTGILFQNTTSASYLDFKYSKHICPHTNNYCSTRFMTQPLFYRPISFANTCTITPEMGGIGIIYGNSPQKKEQWLLSGKAGLEVKTYLHRFYKDYKHCVEPYLEYTYYSPPTSSPNQHYIFDIHDGQTHLNMLKIGCNNSLFKKEENGMILKPLAFHLYTYAFFDTDKIKKTIPRIYGDFVFQINPRLRNSLATAWNFDYKELDYFNWRTEWTLSSDFAISTEFRHRGSYSWRKVDPSNFFLDMFRSEQQLRHSSLSDRRDTFLVHFFYRFHPNWACEFTSRQGWHRRKQPNYFEYEVDFLTTIQTAWQVRLSFQHQENENRVAVYVSVGLKRPTEIEATPGLSLYN